ncbi:DUF4267 domain-containing protein [Streptomyces sp. A0958]|uniref:DUF4267 domain-containing protein n=1 Tax=Streptomyces sp. A0958 TaxID=2563101 RepID=UPI00109E8347|nr:DUF4267 domain-containing protein [Streptomyces sp. A0958]THA67551.1 DUF4267 domain-containing protein [Streptomyces sp. A0958]
MLATIATVVAGLLGAGLVLMGASALIRPQGAAGFGIPDAPVDDPGFRPWLRVKGLREIVPGAFVFVLMAAATSSVLGWYLLVFAGIPAGDALVVLRSGGPKATAYGVHAATSAVMPATGVGLLV